VSFSRYSCALLLLVAACGDLPRPYQGNPGATAQRLSQPPPSRVAVPPSYATFLPSLASKPYSQALAAAMQDAALPAVADYAKAGDWRIDLGVVNRGSTTIPTFTVVDPSGNRKGTEEGRPVPTDTWRKGSPETLKTAAADAAPRILALMERVEAARRQSDPNSLYNRTAIVMVTPVTGAPGDGNITLTRLMREKLAKLGTTVQESATGSDFTLSAKVDYAPLTPKTHRVEITWLLHNTGNVEVGKIVQLNEVPNGLLDKFWGDVAVAATDEAAGAVRDVIMTQSGRRQRQPQQAAAQTNPEQEQLPELYPASGQQAVPGQAPAGPAAAGQAAAPVPGGKPQPQQPASQSQTQTQSGKPARTARNPQSAASSATGAPAAPAASTGTAPATQPTTRAAPRSSNRPATAQQPATQQPTGQQPAAQ